MFGSWWTPLPKLGGERERDTCWDKVLALGAVFGSVKCGKELDVSRDAADATSSFHSLGLVSQDVERRSSWSAGSQRATIPSFCVQRL